VSQTSSGSSARTRSWLGLRLVELGEPSRHVTADDDRAPAGLDDDDLHAGRVTRRRDEPDPRMQLELAIDRHVLHAGRIHPLANRVVVLAASVVEIRTLDVDRLAGEEVVAAAVVEVRVLTRDGPCPGLEPGGILHGLQKKSANRILRPPIENPLGAVSVSATRLPARKIRVTLVMPSSPPGRRRNPAGTMSQSVQAILVTLFLAASLLR
jgi:hypothetical protein